MRTLAIIWLIASLGSSGLMVIWRGATGYIRKYGPMDALCGAIEIGLDIALICWLV